MAYISYCITHMQQPSLLQSYGCGEITRTANINIVQAVPRTATWWQCGAGFILD